jgi:glycosidase
LSNYIRKRGCTKKKCNLFVFFPNFFAMKIFLQTIINLVCFYGLQAQLLIPNPAFPLDTSTVTIIVDCSKGNQGLYNYANTADVYVHTGVITNLSASQIDWRYVKFNQNFNQPNAALKATYLGNNKYSFTINAVRNYYGVPAGETILKIAILFRNGTGSSVERNSDGGDMYVPVFTGSLAAKFLLPAFQPLYTSVPEPIHKSVGDSLTVNYISNQSSTLNLYFNSVAVATAGSTNSLQAVIPIVAPGNQWVVATASNGVSVTSDSFNFFVAGATNFAPLPSGAGEGINYPSGDTSVILVLFAPHKNKVTVVGDFNSWVQEVAYQMNKTPDSNYYWLQINGLTPGTEYAYQYVIDDSLVVADFNTEKVLDKNVDPLIPSSVYPNLKPFPVSARGSLASVIQTAKPVFNWKGSNFQRPDKRNLIVYELLVRDFIAAQNWKTLADTLGYLKRLGVNAIEVMPFSNFEGYSSWGYNPNFYFAPDKVYGTETALKEFIDACHQQGFAVIMDMVLNHSFGSSPMVQMYWDPVNNIPAANNPWFNPYPTHAYNVGYQFNHETQATKDFTRRVVAYWLSNYHIDGYRFDLAKGFTQKRTCDGMGNNCDINAWGLYDSSRVRIWDSIYNQEQSISLGSYCILEMFADNSEQTVEANHGMMLWGNLNYNFNQATMGYNTGWDFSQGIYTSLGWNQPNLVTYQESHDEERLMFKNEQYGNSNGAYNIKIMAIGLKRNAMATAFWAMIPGPKMLWQFGELGYDSSINTCANGSVDPGGNCRLDPKRLPWNFYQDPDRLGLYNVYARLFSLRNTPNFISTFTTGIINKDLSGGVKWLSVSDDSLGVMVVGNFDVIPGSATINFPTMGKWYGYLSDSLLTLSSSSQNINLKPGEFYVFTNRKLRAVDSTTLPPVSINGISLKLNPNPATAGATINYAVPESGPVNISLLDIRGQRIFNLFNGNMTQGSYSLPLYSGGLAQRRLASGVYFIKLNQNGHQKTIKAIVKN